jgi:addiction module HigA family antidote
MNRTPIHPGEILKDELEEVEISCNELAKKLGVPTNRISQITSCKRGITADTALRLGKWFGTGAEFWMNLQKMYELDLAKIELVSELEEIVPLSAA